MLFKSASVQVKSVSIMQGHCSRFGHRTCPCFAATSFFGPEGCVSALLRKTFGTHLRAPALKTKIFSKNKSVVLAKRKNGSTKTLFSLVFQWTAKGASGKGPRQKRQESSKVSRIFSTLFDIFHAGQKTSKIIKKCQNILRHFSTIFARHQFSGPCLGALSFPGFSVQGMILVKRLVARRGLFCLKGKGS